VVGPPTGSSEKGKATTLFYFEKKEVNHSRNVLSFLNLE
jgi:hypothetical protein